MAQQPKKKTVRDGKEGKGDTYKAEDVLQAIIIADSFDERFKPLTLQSPRALLPIANGRTIEYTLEFLARVGVQEILIFCRAHADKIRTYIQSHWKWGLKGRRHRSVSVQVIVSEDCYSMGDALRDIYEKNLIRGDFILVQGDLIANVDLQPALEAHRRRKTSDKTSVMTVVCRQVASRHPARSLEDQVVLTVEPASQRVLHYQKSASDRKIRFPKEVLDSRDDVEIRCDLLDCHISICSPEVLSLFFDNFDYLTRDDFVRGILVNEEVMGNSIHCFVLNIGYTARISNFHMYDVVSRDIIARWVYPLCPDLGFPEGDAYFYKRHHIYQQRDVQLAMGSVLEENVIVGRNCTVGEDTVIRNSVIGNDCKIGAKCVIDGAYIWDGCVIEAGCQLGKCLLANQCFIGKDSVILAGAVVSYGVRIGPNARISVGTRLIGDADQILLTTGSENEESLFLARPADQSVLGESKYSAWTFELTSNDVASDQDSDAPVVNFEEISWTWWTPHADVSHDMQDDISSSDEESSSDYAGPMEDGVTRPSRPPVEDARIFFNEISDSLFRGLYDQVIGDDGKYVSVDADHLKLEINGSKFAYNVNMGELNKLIIRATLELPEIRARQEKREFASAKEVNENIQKALKTLLPLFKNYYRSTESQLDALFAIEDCAVNYLDLPRHQPYGAFFFESVMNIVHYLYDQDILPEGVILKWFTSPSKSHVVHFIPFFLHETSMPISPRRRHQSGDLSDEDITALVRKIDLLKKKLEPFIKWLKEAEEESD